MSAPIIVALCGTAGSGKSLVCDRLRDLHGYAIVSLAAPIKHVVGELFGFTDRQLYGPSATRSEPHPTLKRADGSPLTARAALQVIGTDMTRTLCPNIWIEKALAEADSKILPVAIPDVRFINEMEAIRARGGVLVRRTWEGGPTDPHPSETEQLSLPDSYFDFVLPRYPHKEDLLAAVDAMARRISGRVRRSA